MKVLAIITGILTAILGIYGLCVPFRVFLGLGWLIGILYMVNGIEIIVGAFHKQKNIWQCILGVIVAIFGVLMLGRVGLRFLNDLMIAYFAGIAVVAYGINMIIEGCKSMKQSKGMGILSLICGVIAILVGIFAFMHPVLTMISVGYIICLNILIQGVNMAVLAFAYKAPAEA